MAEPKKFKEKMAYFFGNYWNFITVLAIIIFIIGFAFRVNPTTRFFIFLILIILLVALLVEL